MKHSVLYRVLELRSRPEPSHELYVVKMVGQAHLKAAAMAMRDYMNMYPATPHSKYVVFSQEKGSPTMHLEK